MAIRIIKNSKRIFFTCILIAALALFFLVTLQGQEPMLNLKSVLMDGKPHHESNIGKRCKRPVVSPFNEDVLPYLESPTPLDCTQEHNKNSSYRGIAFTIKNGHQLHRLADVGMPCCIQPFFRDGERNVKLSGICNPITHNVTKVPRDNDYILINCGTNGNYVYRDAFAVVHEKPEVETRIHEYLKGHTEANSNNNLNVIVLGLDSTSRLNFLRKMPKSNEFLLSKLSAIPLKGYNKVGLNTLPNTLPLLTGISRVEFENECINRQGSELDDCPLLRKLFSRAGYRTVFAEDELMFPLFRPYENNSFRQPPTDYYFTPFAVYMTSLNKFGTLQEYCYGPRLSYETLLEYSKNVFEIFGTERRHFQFIWASQIGHVDLNKLGWADELLLSYLKYLHNSSFLKQTVLLILGDHGFRYRYDYPATTHGKLEDRMPLAYIVLPPSFKTSYSYAYANLMNNSEKMTTAYDVHKTLLDLMNLTRLETDIKTHDNQHHKESFGGAASKGISLFEPIPEDRKCLEAGISVHWCLLCYPKVSLSTNASIVQDATDFVITSLNELLKNHKQLCTTITLKSVDEASKWDQRDVFREVCNFDGNFASYRGTTWRSLHISCDNSRIPHEYEVTILQVSLTVLPQNTVFEAKLARVQGKKWLHVENVVRYDEYDYDKQGWCVKGNHLIHPYCFCKNQTESL